MRTLGVWLVILFSLSVPLPGDQVTMTNGDRLSGAILKSDAKNLSMKSDLAGTVTIPWVAIDTLTSTAPLHVVLKGGQTVAGLVRVAGNTAEVQTQEAGRVTSTREAIEALRSKDEEAAYQAELDRLRNPRLLDLWSGFLETGLAATSGNAKTTTFNLGANATRTTKRDKIGVDFTSLYGKSRTGGATTTVANAVRGGINYDLNITERVFGFGLTTLEFDEFQKLDLRFTGGGGLGWHAVKTEFTAFDLFGGGSLNKEFFSTGARRTSGEALVGEEFNHKVSGATSVHQRLVLFPNVSDIGEYRVNFDLSGVTAVRKWLSWNVTFSNRFLSNPIPGVKKNDLLLTTGLRLTFAR